VAQLRDVTAQAFHEWEMIGNFSPSSTFQNIVVLLCHRTPQWLKVDACKGICQCIQVYHTNTLVHGSSGSGTVSHEVAGGTMVGKIKLSAEQKRK